MTTTVVITGTGVPFVTPGRAGPGVLVQSNDVRLQFDAGRATTLRLAEAGVRTSMLDALFVTHHHSDHLTGLTDLVLTRWIENAAGFRPLPIVYPAGPLDRLLGTLLDPWADDIAVRTDPVGRTDHPAPDLRPVDVSPLGSDPVVAWQGGPEDEVSVTAVAVRHEPVLPSVGYRIDTPDGSVVVSGDTTVCSEIETLATDAKVLVHEAFCRSAYVAIRGDSEFTGHLARTHADTIELGAMAARIGISTLVLTHLIPPPGMGTITKEVYVDDVRAGGFSGEVVVADDLDRVEF